MTVTMAAGATIDAAFDVLRDCVQEGLVPGAAAAVGTKDGTLRREHYGYAQVTPPKRPLPDDALFDLASLTKVVCTTTLTLRFLEQGKLHLGQRVASVLPAFGAAGKEDVTVRHLLTHTSGLPAWRDLHSAGQGRAAARQQVYAEPLERPTGSAVVYSDLGFIALGALLEEVGGVRLDALAAREVFAPLGLRRTRFGVPARQRPRCAATELLGSRPLVGIVHDENARAQDGVSGHAGLFSNCADLERFCRMWLGSGVVGGERFLSRGTVEAATRDQTGLRDRRGLGWVLQPNPFWVPADLCSPLAYSHTGFTGTSLLLDPAHGVYAVLLTNRVHPTRSGGSAERVRTVRARFHNAVWAAVTG